MLRTGFIQKFSSLFLGVKQIINTAFLKILETLKYMGCLLQMNVIIKLHFTSTNSFITVHVQLTPTKGKRTVFPMGIKTKCRMILVQ